MKHWSYHKHELIFAFDARTSRGAIKKHTAWIIKVTENDAQGNRTGLGEASPLKGLSLDYGDLFEEEIAGVLSLLNDGGTLHELPLQHLPSLKFGIETALLSLMQNGMRNLFDSGFCQGEPIKINGLVWMNQSQAMLEEAIKKVRQGFDCIKFKVGALDFDEECRMLETFRKSFGEGQVEIRLDANGAFSADDAYAMLKDLKKFGIHSIEQPVKPGNTEVMAKLCKDKPINIALDEELIGKEASKDEALIFKSIRPQFLILKPTLIGGLEAADNWILKCHQYGIGWWATSALESNIGLNAIAQWVATKHNSLPQGLGTGSLYENNFPSPLIVNQGYLHYFAGKEWEVSYLE